MLRMAVESWIERNLKGKCDNDADMDNLTRLYSYSSRLVESGRVSAGPQKRSEVGITGRQGLVPFLRAAASSGAISFSTRNGKIHIA